MKDAFTPEWLEAHRVEVDGMGDDQVVGIGHVMAELASILGRLADPDRAAALGARLPRGVIFSGRPGTGKTLCARWFGSKLSARARADGQAAVPFYELSSDELSPERMRGLMRYLADTHPRSAVYLDEIDSWALYRDSDEHSAETRMLLTAALAALDGLVPTAGPVVMASSTRPVRLLDAALRRPGRLGLHVAFDLPDEPEREALLRLYARGHPMADDIDWAHAARLTREETPAAIAQLIDDAAGIALAAGHASIEMADVLAAIRRGGEVVPDTLDQLDPAVLARTCLHEAGHVAVGVGLEGPNFVYSVRLTPVGGATAVGAESVDLALLPDGLLRSHLAVGYGGLAAELAVYGDATLGAEEDLSSVTQGLLRRLGAGLDRGFPPISPSGFGHQLPEVLRARQAEAAIATADELRVLAEACVAANRDAIVRFAAILAQARELSGAALQSAIAQAGFVRIERPGSGSQPGTQSPAGRGPGTATR